MIHSKTVDIHCHLATPATRELAASYFQPEFEPYDFFMSRESRARNAEMFPTIVSALTDPAARLGDMDRMGIDVQGLSSFVSEYFYWTPPTLGAELSRMQNDRLAEVVAERPDRFVGLGATVPLQDVDAAIVEAERVKKLGFKGLQIGGTVMGRNLDEPGFRPFFAAVRDLDLGLILHPSGYPEGHRLDRYFLTNCIGNPLETMVAATRLIFSGLVEELPGLKLVLVHGGGYLPFYASRSDHTWEVRPETRANIPDHPPSHYMRQLYFDSMVFSPLYLRHLIDVVGVERVMIGTDYPFDMSERDPLGLVAGVESLDEAGQTAISGGNATRVFGL